MGRPGALRHSVRKRSRAGVRLVKVARGLHGARVCDAGKNIDTARSRTLRPFVETLIEMWLQLSSIKVCHGGCIPCIVLH